ncbi:NAD(P)/FAD-dependent oxidoreductase [Mycobacterium sp.]|uniref:NAD(P)/FAD-dependent oxidoreductase n=1 Tax=Mycobacterium sp. TaxID=1785 RepID=UPI002CA6CB2D|nr:NAD(P)/FAD-dependent oxidoreductase [Mycobacterium sp.]HTQ17308.1 NAD(P)/FAD-dependent oxidoreductase [Mycobacterium sp.]
MNATATRGDRHRVVIVGCGFAGLFAAKELRRQPVEITVIDRVNHHLFQPLLYQVATGILSEGDIAPPIRDVLRHQRNTNVMLGDVDRIDLQSRTLGVDSFGARADVPYDSLIIATGANQSYFGHPEFAQHAPGMKTIDDALELRARIFGAFEMAEREPDAERQRSWLTFAVVGAGPTGVEVAGQIAELARRSLHDNFRRIDPSSARVVLLDAAPKLLGPFPEALQRRAREDLERRGVEIHLGVMVTGVDERGIETNAADPGLKRLEADTKIWAAGVQASPLGRLVAEAAGADVDRAGRVQVQPDCTLPGYPDVFVVGDLMALDHLPGLAQVAIQSGQHAARTIAARLGGDPSTRAFAYRDKGTMATVSRFRAIASIGRINLSGFPAWLLWLAVHLFALTGFKNRLATVFNWAIAFLGRGRPQRAITAQQAFARETLRAQTAARDHGREGRRAGGAA